MPEERQFPDDRDYREWHRKSSISRFMTTSEAESLWLIDTDLVEACRKCSEPLLIAEATRDKGQLKNASITKAMGRLMNRPAALVYYTKDSSGDLTGFRVRWLWPTEKECFYTPQQWADGLLKIRRDHDNEAHF